MANEPNVSFYNVATLPNTVVKGGLYFVNNMYNGSTFPNSGFKQLYIATGTTKASCVPVGMNYGANNTINVPSSYSSWSLSRSLNAPDSGYAGYSINEIMTAASYSLYVGDNDGGSSAICYCSCGASNNDYPRPSIYWNISTEMGENSHYLTLYPGSNGWDGYLQYSWEYYFGDESASLTVYKDKIKMQFDDQGWSYFGDAYGYLDIMYGYSDQGDVKIGHNSYGWVTIQDIINHITCFRGDSTYVTMYDGSKKLIKDVKDGESVLGYDVNKKELCEAIVLRNAKTGAEMGFDCYVMDDGTTIDIHGKDAFITVQKKDDADYISLNDINNLWKLHENAEDYKKIIKEDAKLENAVSLIHKVWLPCAEATDRYSIYTSNGTCFVNGLLHCESPRDTICFFKKRHFDLPDNIKSLYEGIALDMAEDDEKLPNDHIKNVKSVGDLERMEKAKALITKNKAILQATDYKAMKYAEGALSEEEWLPVKEKRAQARADVNANEEIVAEYKARVEIDNPEILHSVSSRVENSKWKARQQILDNHLEDFREWKESIKKEKEELKEARHKESLKRRAEALEKKSKKGEDK